MVSWPVCSLQRKSRLHTAKSTVRRWQRIPVILPVDGTEVSLAAGPLPSVYSSLTPTPVSREAIASQDLRTLLDRIRAGDNDARDRLFASLYEDLRHRASREIRRVGSGSLDTTGLVHEAYMRVRRVRRLEPTDRLHFMHIAGRAMRQVLIDRARRRLRQKRGGGRPAVRLDDVQLGADSAAEDLVALDEALSRLEKEDERLARVVHLRFFAGQSLEETAEVLSVSITTVKRDWRLARAMLHAWLDDSESPSRSEDDDAGAERRPG